MSTRKPVRIVHPERQVAAVVIGFFLVYGAGISVALTASTAVAGGVTAAALIAVVVFCARTFRGADEPVTPPRPWWKMTAKPAASFVWAVLFGLQSVNVFWLDAAAPELWVAPAVSALIAVAFLYSGLRLRAAAARPA